MYSLILHGRRSFDLRVAVKQIVFSAFSSTTSAPKGKAFTVSYLVDSLGFTTKLAESIFKKATSESKANPDSVLNLLKSHAFTDSQISRIITNYPRLLILDAEKSLSPKFQFLISRGDSTSELTEILTKVPKIMGLKKDKAFSVYYDFIKEVIEADKSSKKLSLSKSSSSSRQENKLRNILVLRDLGVSQKLLFSLLFSNFQTVTGEKRFQETLKKVLEMGFDPTTSRFVQALNAVYQLSHKGTEFKVNVLCTELGVAVAEVWEMFRKSPSLLTLSENNILNSVEAFLGLGFSRDEFAMLVKCHPQCLNYSKEMVKRKIEFLVKEMNWTLKAVVSNPSVLGYSLERRIVPRCNVIKALMSRGLIGSELPSVGSVLLCTSEVFLERYVMKHDDADKKLVAELMAILTRDDCVYQLSDKTIQEKVNVLCTKLGFSVCEVWEMFKKNPSLLTLSEKNVVNSVEVFIGLGFSRDEFATLVKCQPQCLNYSTEMVKKKVEFLVKEMNWTVKAIVSNPAVIGYSLERRIVPRCNVIRALMSRGLIGSELPSVGSVLLCTSEVFLERYVMKHDDADKKLVAELMAILTGDCVS